MPLYIHANSPLRACAIARAHSQFWCGMAPGFESNCMKPMPGMLHCCGCDECAEYGVTTRVKWWDRGNYYDDKSCLIWGVEAHETGPKEIGGTVVFRSFCSVERPICNGHDCNPPSERDWDNSFWCAANRDFGRFPTLNAQEGSYSQMLPDEWIEQCCTSDGQLAMHGHGDVPEGCPRLDMPPSPPLPPPPRPGSPPPPSPLPPLPPRPPPSPLPPVPANLHPWPPTPTPWWLSPPPPPQGWKHQTYLAHLPRNPPHVPPHPPAPPSLPPPPPSPPLNFTYLYTAISPYEGEMAAYYRHTEEMAKALTWRMALVMVCMCAVLSWLSWTWRHLLRTCVVRWAKRARVYALIRCSRAPFSWCGGARCCPDPTEPASRAHMGMSRVAADEADEHLPWMSRCVGGGLGSVRCCSCLWCAEAKQKLSECVGCIRCGAGRLASFADLFSALRQRSHACFLGCWQPCTLLLWLRAPDGSERGVPSSDNRQPADNVQTDPGDDDDEERLGSSDRERPERPLAYSSSLTTSHTQDSHRPRFSPGRPPSSLHAALHLPSRGPPLLINPEAARLPSLGANYLDVLRRKFGRGAADPQARFGPCHRSACLGHRGASALLMDDDDADVQPVDKYAHDARGLGGGGVPRHDASGATRQLRVTAPPLQPSLHNQGQGKSAGDATSLRAALPSALPLEYDFD